jgi:hypothetical protein
MGQARHLLSFSVLVGVALAVALAGCGSSVESPRGSESTAGTSTPTSTAPEGATVQTCGGAIAGVSQLRASEVGCPVARRIAASWETKRDCEAATGASRTACSIGRYRCLGTATERGLAVSCAAADGSISFVVKRG